ncbi:hypothetical protein [Paenibacillus ihuae]|uniref:hypothetical protein n=1 Tax=Paenibacillus ihuae TaxID=1232431 RepID=UPI000A9B0091|nr:hypothetical protein [Paenibacillus ihuae]
MDADKKESGREPVSQYVELAVEVFSMLADATRVRLILALRNGERSVSPKCYCLISVSSENRLFK